MTHSGSVVQPVSARITMRENTGPGADQRLLAGACQPRHRLERGSPWTRTTGCSPTVRSVPEPVHPSVHVDLQVISSPRVFGGVRVATRSAHRRPSRPTPRPPLRRDRTEPSSHDFKDRRRDGERDWSAHLPLLVAVAEPAWRPRARHRPAAGDDRVLDQRGGGRQFDQHRTCSRKSGHRAVPGTRRRIICSNAQPPGLPSPSPKTTGEGAYENALALLRVELANGDQFHLRPVGLRTATSANGCRKTAGSP